eukprot:m.650369 g.650369  ORF g.650369 m.650369 type:complete len:318 (+) comp22671_c0_seq3:382-1335(+)
MMGENEDNLEMDSGAIDETMDQSSEFDNDDADDGSRSSGVLGRDFVKSQGAAGEADNKEQKTSGWSRFTSGLKKSIDQFGSEVKDLTTKKGFSKFRQQVAESMGTKNKTIDVELQNKIEVVKKGQNDMKVLGELVKQVAKTMAKLTEDQLALSACLQHLSEEHDDAQADFECHHRIQDVMSKNALCLIEAFKFFQEEIARFIKNELQPAWMQVNVYENTRVEYDACRLSFESLKSSAGTDSMSQKQRTAEAQLLEAYNRLSEVRGATWSKLCLVDARSIDMYKAQLKGLANAHAMYLTGNTAAFEEAMSKLDNPEDA